MRLHGLVIFVVLLCLFLTPSATAQTANGGVNSLILHYTNGDINHYQVTEDKLTRIWTKSGDIDYQYVTITDLDKNGQNEILMVSGNEGLQLLDLESGTQIWTYDYVFGGYGVSSVTYGDLTGNGLDEIVVARTAQQPNFALDIFDSSGNLIDQINHLEGGDQNYGVDNVEIFDIDLNGDNELIVSYGSVLWNYNQSVGSYAIERYDWQTTEQTFTQTFQIQGDDNGGNTAMRLLPDRIITSGWYNNPIRAFDGDGNEIWNVTLYDSNSVLRIADTAITTITNNEGNNEIIAFSQNYWSNFTMKALRIAPETGDIIESIELFDYEALKLVAKNNKVITSMLKTTQSGNDVSSYENIRQYYFEGDTFVHDDWNNDQNQWRFVLRDFHNLLVIDIGSELYVIGSDTTGNAFLGNDGNRMELPLQLESVQAAHVSEVDTEFEGTIIIEYNTDINTIFIIGIIGFALLFSAFLYYAYIRYTDRKFDLSFGNNWKELFRLKIEKLIAGIKQNLTEPILIEPLTKEFPDLSETFEKGLFIPAISREIEPTESQPNYKLKQISDTNSTSIFELLNSETQVAKQIKIGDMGILIEILNNYPEPTEITEIIPKLKFASKTTIYKRIDKMIELNLLENIDETELFLKNRTRTVKLSESGIQLLAILYNSLEQED